MFKKKAKVIIEVDMDKRMIVCIRGKHIEQKDTVKVLKTAYNLMKPRKK